MLMAVIAGTCTVVYQSGSKNVPNEKEFVLNEGDSIDEAMKTEEKETTEENRNSETQNPESKDPETQDVNTSQVEGERVMEEETEEREETSIKGDASEEQIAAEQKAWTLINKYADPDYFLTDPERNAITDAQFEELRQATVLYH